MTQEKGNTCEGITTVMQFRHDDTTIAFTTDHSTNFFHFLNHIHFTNGTGLILLTCLFSNIAKGTCTRKVTHCWSGRMFQIVIGHGHQRIFFAEHFGIFTNQGEAIYIGIHNNTQITFC